MNAHSTCFLGVLRTILVAGVLFLAGTYESTANAAQGCGQGFHRGYYGACRINHPGPYARPAPYHPGCWRNAAGYLRCYRR